MHVLGKFYACSGDILCMFRGSSIHVPRKFYACSGEVLCMFWGCSMGVLGKFYACSGDVLGKFYACSGDVPCMFQGCSMHVLGKFYACSGDVLWVFWGCSKEGQSMQSVLLITTVQHNRFRMITFLYCQSTFIFTISWLASCTRLPMPIFLLSWQLSHLMRYSLLYS